MITVVRDSEGDLWIRTGRDRWTMPCDVELERPAMVDRWSKTWDELDARYGPMETVFEVSE